MQARAAHQMTVPMGSIDSLISETWRSGCGWSFNLVLKLMGGNGSLNQDVIRERKGEGREWVSKGQEWSSRKICLLGVLKPDNHAAVVSFRVVSRTFGEELSQAVKLGAVCHVHAFFYVLLHRPELGQSQKTRPHPSAWGRNGSRFASFSEKLRRRL